MGCEVIGGVVSEYVGEYAGKKLTTTPYDYGAEAIKDKLNAVKDKYINNPMSLQEAAQNELDKGTYDQQMNNAQTGDDENNAEYSRFQQKRNGNHAKQQKYAQQAAEQAAQNRNQMSRAPTQYEPGVDDGNYDGANAGYDVGAALTNLATGMATAAAIKDAQKTIKVQTSPSYSSSGSGQGQSSPAPTPSTTIENIDRSYCGCRGSHSAK
jgi:hypothetical protein